MPRKGQGRLLDLALRCYPPSWHARHGDEARELAALLARDGVPARSMAWDYLVGAAREQIKQNGTTRRVRTGAAALVAATSLAAASLLVSMPPAPAGAAGVVRAEVTVRSEAAAQLEAVFKSHHFDIGVEQLPVSPSLVGSVLATTTTERSPGSDGIVGRVSGPCAGGTGTCTEGLLLPSHFSGQMLVLVGRAAKFGEKYADSASIFQAGEILASSHLLGRTVAVAGPVLDRLHVDVQWEVAGNRSCASARPDGSYRLAGGVAISARSICLEVARPARRATGGQG